MILPATVIAYAVFYLLLSWLLIALSVRAVRRVDK